MQQKMEGIGSTECVFILDLLVLLGAAPSRQVHTWARLIPTLKPASGPPLQMDADESIRHISNPSSSSRNFEMPGRARYLLHFILKQKPLIGKPVSPQVQSKRVSCVCGMLAASKSLQSCIIAQQNANKWLFIQLQVAAAWIE